MEFPKIMAFIWFIIVAFGTSMAADKQVDWTVGKDYKDWALDNELQVGDILVNKKDFESCSTASPMASYSSGRDSIPLTTPGPYYFLCGYPGHCEAGQKLKIKVRKSDKNGGQSTTPSSPGQTCPYTPQVGPVSQSSPPVSTANWLTAFKAFVGIFAASYICGLAL